MARLRLIAFCVVAGFTTGCDDGRPARVPVAGYVTIDSQPLPEAIVTFHPASGRPSYAHTDSTGRFVLECYGNEDGAQLGKHQVTIMALQQTGPTTRKWFAPKKYASRTASGLEYQIDKPIEDLHIDLSWDGGKPFTETSGGGD